MSLNDDCAPQLPSPLLSVEDLRISFFPNGQKAEAVKGIHFSIQPGEKVAVVGESGSGKSVTALALTQLLDPRALVSGRVYYKSKDLLALSPSEIRSYRGKAIAYVFQEAGAALNPVFSIGHQIREAVLLNDPSCKDSKARVVELLRQVGIKDAEVRYRAYPHELSGGMQQRSMIAMALASKPNLLVADEPTTALDVTTQRQVIHLLARLARQLGMAVLLITHNFGIVAGFAERILVMLQGKIVESGPTQQVLYHPRHRQLLETPRRHGQLMKQLEATE